MFAIEWVNISRCCHSMRHGGVLCSDETRIQCAVARDGGVYTTSETALRCLLYARVTHYSTDYVYTAYTIDTLVLDDAFSIPFYGQA